MTMDVLPRVLALVALTLVPLLILGVLGFATGIRPPRSVSSRTPADLGWAYEPVTLRTADGLAISGWFIPRDDQPGNRPVIIVLHGYPYDKANVLGVTPFLHRHYDLLLIDFRYFGKSEGQVTTLGHQEWQDVLAAVDYARGRGATSIGVWGFSLGGAVALLTLPHTESIAAVAADSAFSDLGAMVMDYYRFLPLADRALAGLTELLARLFLGIAPSEVSPERAIAGTTTPILLIHSSSDSTIPVSHYHRLSRALANNAGADFWLLDRAAHGMSYASNQHDYETRVLGFFQRHLK
jgi:dipeptidyl aminopeptidase/acylaminoacyl peptidase